MIDIPLNKALVATQGTGRMSDCGEYVLERGKCGAFHCSSRDRKDGKNVIFKLVDLPIEENRQRLEAVMKRAKDMGVMGIEIDGKQSADTLECLERTLNIIEHNKKALDGI